MKNDELDNNNNTTNNSYTQYLTALEKTLIRISGIGDQIDQKMLILEPSLEGDIRKDPEITISKEENEKIKKFDRAQRENAFKLYNRKRDAKITLLQIYEELKKPNIDFKKIYQGINIVNRKIYELKETKTNDDAIISAETRTSVISEMEAVFLEVKVLLEMHKIKSSLGQTLDQLESELKVKKNNYNKLEAYIKDYNDNIRKIRKKTNSSLINAFVAYIILNIENKYEKNLEILIIKYLPDCHTIKETIQKSLSEIKEQLAYSNYKIINENLNIYWTSIDNLNDIANNDINTTDVIKPIISKLEHDFAEIKQDFLTKHIIEAKKINLQYWRLNPSDYKLLEATLEEFVQKKGKDAKTAKKVKLPDNTEITLMYNSHREQLPLISINFGAFNQKVDISSLVLKFVTLCPQLKEISLSGTKEKKNTITEQHADRIFQAIAEAQSIKCIKLNYTQVWLSSLNLLLNTLSVNFKITEVELNNMQIIVVNPTQHNSAVEIYKKNGDNDTKIHRIFKWEDGSKTEIVFDEKEPQEKILQRLREAARINTHAPKLESLIEEGFKNLKEITDKITPLLEQHKINDEKISLKIQRMLLILLRKKFFSNPDKNKRISVSSIDFKKIFLLDIILKDFESIIQDFKSENLEINVLNAEFQLSSILTQFEGIKNNIDRGEISDPIIFAKKIFSSLLEVQQNISGYFWNREKLSLTTVEDIRIATTATKVIIITLLNHFIKSLKNITSETYQDEDNFNHYASPKFIESLCDLCKKNNLLDISEIQQLKEFAESVLRSKTERVVPKNLTKYFGIKLLSETERHTFAKVKSRSDKSFQMLQLILTKLKNKQVLTEEEKKLIFSPKQRTIIKDIKIIQNIIDKINEDKLSLTQDEMELFLNEAPNEAHAKLKDIFKKINDSIELKVHEKSYLKQIQLSEWRRKQIFAAEKLDKISDKIENNTLLTNGDIDFLLRERSIDEDLYDQLIHVIFKLYNGNVKLEIPDLESLFIAIENKSEDIFLLNLTSKISALGEKIRAIGEADLIVEKPIKMFINATLFTENIYKLIKENKLETLDDQIKPLLLKSILKQIEAYSILIDYCKYNSKEKEEISEPLPKAAEKNLFIIQNNMEQFISLQRVLVGIIKAELYYQANENKYSQDITATVIDEFVSLECTLEDVRLLLSKIPDTYPLLRKKYLNVFFQENNSKLDLHLSENNSLQNLDEIFYLNTYTAITIRSFLNQTINFIEYICSINNLNNKLTSDLQTLLNEITHTGSSNATASEKSVAEYFSDKRKKQDLLKLTALFKDKLAKVVPCFLKQEVEKIYAINILDDAKLNLVTHARELLLQTKDFNLENPNDELKNLPLKVIYNYLENICGYQPLSMTSCIPIFINLTYLHEINLNLMYFDFNPLEIYLTNSVKLLNEMKQFQLGLSRKSDYIQENKLAYLNVDIVFKVYFIYFHFLLKKLHADMAKNTLKNKITFFGVFCFTKADDQHQNDWDIFLKFFYDVFLSRNLLNLCRLVAVFVFTKMLDLKKSLELFNYYAQFNKINNLIESLLGVLDVLYDNKTKNIGILTFIGYYKLHENVLYIWRNFDKKITDKYSLCINEYCKLSQEQSLKADPILPYFLSAELFKSYPCEDDEYKDKQFFAVETLIKRFISTSNVLESKHLLNEYIPKISDFIVKNLSDSFDEKRYYNIIYRFFSEGFKSILNTYKDKIEKSELQARLDALDSPEKITKAKFITRSFSTLTELIQNQENWETIIFTNDKLWTLLKQKLLLCIELSPCEHSEDRIVQNDNYPDDESEVKSNTTARTTDSEKDPDFNLPSTHYSFQLTTPKPNSDNTMKYGKTEVEEKGENSSVYKP